MYRGLLDGVVGVVQQGGSSGRLHGVLSLAVTPLAALGFWASVGLPLAYIPLFLAGVVDGAVAGQLLALHALAVVVGHSYGR